MSDIVALVANAVTVLDYTTEDIEHLRDEKFGGKFDHVIDDMVFLKALDSVEFQCVACSYWKPQRENATPDHSQWACTECVADGDYEVPK